MKKSFTFILFLVSISLNLFSQNNLNQDLKAKYDYLNINKNPGFFIGIIKSGTPVYTRSFGMANVENEIAFSARTVSDMGSVSKQLTVMGILLLQEEGKISLQDNIHKHLPDLPPLNEVVNIEHLIHHTSGIPDVYALHSLKGFRYGDHISQSDAFRFLKARPVVDYTPGSKYRYSNTGYMLLAEIISKVSEEGFEDFMQEQIFKPLGMTHTYIMDIPGEIFPQMADSYIPYAPGVINKLYDNSTLQGGGGVYSSGYDMLKWIDNFRTNQIGSMESFKFMLSNAILNDGTTIKYGGGINIDTYRGLKRYHHNGSSAGARTRLVYYPQYELGFVAKSNTTAVGYRDFSEIENLLIDHYLSDVADPRPEDPPEEERNENDSIKFESKEYAGQYYSGLLDLTILVSTTEEGIQLNNFYYPFPPLQYQGDEAFSNNGNQVTFTRDEKGVITTMKMETPRASNIIFIKRK